MVALVRTTSFMDCRIHTIYNPKKKKKRFIIVKLNHETMIQWQANNIQKASLLSWNIGNKWTSLTVCKVGLFSHRVIFVKYTTDKSEIPTKYTKCKCELSTWGKIHEQLNEGQERVLRGKKFVWIWEEFHLILNKGFRSCWVSNSNYPNKWFDPLFDFRRVSSRNVKICVNIFVIWLCILFVNPSKANISK